MEESYRPIVPSSSGEQRGAHWGIEPRRYKSTVRFLLGIPLLQWLLSRARIIHSLACRSAELFGTPVGWKENFPHTLDGQSDHRWTQICIQDTLQPLGLHPWADLLDHRIAAKAWHQGAEWGVRNADKLQHTGTRQDS
jgi:hypothetical protein